MIDTRYSNNVKVVEKLVDYINKREFNDKIHFTVKIDDRNRHRFTYYDDDIDTIEVEGAKIKKILRISYDDILNYENGNLLSGIFTSMIEIECELAGEPCKSSKGYYHNKKLYIAAKRHGCTAVKHPNKYYGWFITNVPDWAEEYLNTCGIYKYNFYNPQQIKRKQNFIRYSCPKCGRWVRNTSNNDRLICGYCSDLSDIPDEFLVRFVREE